MSDWHYLDRQLFIWETKLRDDVGLSSMQAHNVASSISNEVTLLPSSAREELRHSSPISLESRLDEIAAFQYWMDISKSINHPAITRAKVITQNYICFVYLKESWFEALGKVMAPQTVTALCCAFMLSEPLRRFRNAFAHGNWQYLQDFSGLEFWARTRNSGKKEVRSEVSQLDLNFWQILSRCTTYASMQTLIELGT